MRNIFAIWVLLICLFLTGCSGLSGNKVEISGEIIAFNGEKVSILSGDIAADYEIGADSLRDYYIGEKVKVVKSGWNKYRMIKDERFYSDEKYTSYGELILKVSGMVTEKNETEFLMSCEYENIKFAMADNFSVDEGSSYIVKYIKGSEENKVLSVINKESEMCLSVRDIVREDATGIMKIETVNSDEERYDVCIVYGTILDVDPYDIKINDNILVYPKSIDGENPKRVDARLISK